MDNEGYRDNFCIKWNQRDFGITIHNLFRKTKKYSGKKYGSNDVDLEKHIDDSFGKTTGKSKGKIIFYLIRVILSFEKL